ncbi:transmembrane protein 43-like isoform X2 [Amphiura filiformis]|uniref:transmembrane protein 43-like isoform X2 n=1 Tax=Amphiura filiformis TaxID=82378 RepID=UPI003B22743A
MYRSRYPDDPGMHNVGGFQDGDKYTKVSYKENPSLLDRISQTFAGGLLGLGIFVVSFFILFANEGRAVQTATALEECLSLVIPVENSNMIYQENNNKLIHITGYLRTDQALKDGMTGVEIQAVKLRREVEMYQWVEHKRTREIKENKQTKIETDFMYTKEWKNNLISSDLFDNPHRHQNQREFPIKPTTYVAVHTYVGSYYLKEGLKAKIEEFISYTPKTNPPDPNIKYVDGRFYTGMPRTPQVGDARITYSYAGLSGPQTYHLGPPNIVSIIAKQSGSQLTKYQTQSEMAIELLHYGEKTADEMVQDEVDANTALTWLLRAGGWFMMFMGLYLMTNIINRLVSWIPLVRTLVSFGLTVFNLTVSFTLSLITISLGWFYYRPLMAIALIAVALTPSIITYIRGQRKSEDNRV